ncbi:MAG: CHAD domain-containing protein [Solirubrobacterales bacterium]|nr:CHAD domain-containing protein [Solirubrobacterales bacterium]
MEIERKFLVDRTPPELDGSGGVQLLQGYLSISQDSEIRLRQAGAQTLLTVKRGKGESREEVEVALDQSAFTELWPLTDGVRVEKVRHRLSLDGDLVAEVDIYSGDLDGTSVVEVEFASLEAAFRFEPPAWFGRELTGDPAWANQSLAVAGKPDKGLEFRLRPGEDPGTGICRIVAARTSQALANVRAAGHAKESAEHVHEARKSLKKSRSALRLLRGVISDEERRDSNERCRGAARMLSGPRDAEVKLATLASVLGDSEDPAAQAWRIALEGEADVHRGDLNPRSLKEVRHSIEEVRRKFQGRTEPGELQTVVANLGRGYRRGRDSMKAARKSGEPEHFHDWRKRAKDLRYQLEMLEPRLSSRFTELREMAEELAEMLGDLHDLDVLGDDLARRALNEESKVRMSALIFEARDQLVQDCLALGRDTYRQKPGKFINRLGEDLRAD